MGKIPLVSLKPAPAFNVVQLDLFGPWAVRGEVQKRTTGKVWGVILLSRRKELEEELIGSFPCRFQSLPRFSRVFDKNCKEVYKNYVFLQS